MSHDNENSILTDGTKELSPELRQLNFLHLVPKNSKQLVEEFLKGTGASHDRTFENVDLVALSKTLKRT